MTTKKQKQNTEIYNIVNSAIDTAVSVEKYNLNFYSFLQIEKVTRNEILSFLNSSLVDQIKDEITHLDMYLEENLCDLKEVYGWMGKPRVRKYKEYLIKIVEDAEQYEREKRPGRKSGSKIRKKAATANK